MPFIVHGDVSFDGASFSRGDVVSDALGEALALDHPGLMSRVAPDPDLVPIDLVAAAPAPAPAPSKPALVVAPFEVK